MAKKTKAQIAERNKLFLAIFLTSLILLGIVFVSVFLFSPQNDNDDIDADVNISRTELLGRLSASANSGLKPGEVLVQTVKLTDLPVYPIEWQKKFFKPSELSNQLVAGESADPDNDNLTNKEEYFQGSSPINPDTLCGGEIDNERCFGKNDGENVADGISPLTGLELETQPEFIIKRQDFSILDNIQDTFEIAAREGVDFPSLYVLSNTIDLSNEIDEIQVLEQSDSRENVINYTKIRVDILEGFIDTDELTNFAEIYQITEISELDAAQQEYLNFKDRMINTTVPTKFVPSHKAYILIFDKMAELIELRKEGLQNKDLLTQNFKDRSRDKAVEVVWGYKELNEQISILEQDFTLEEE